MPATLKILLADDHEVVRRGLRHLLLDAFPEVEFGEAGNAGDTIELTWRCAWDLVILDINMPGRSGLEVLAELKARQPGLRVLILSMASEAEYAVRALKKGAAGYLGKDSVGDELILAVRKILGGGRYLSGAVMERLAADLGAPEAGERHAQLSDRELQVLRLIATGRSTKEIAQELSLSDKTVFTYRDRLRIKLDLGSDVALTRYALQHRLVE